MPAFALLFELCLIDREFLLVVAVAHLHKDVDAVLQQVPVLLLIDALSANSATKFQKKPEDEKCKKKANALGAPVHA